MKNNPRWAEDIYFRAKNAGCEPHEIIYKDCPYPRLAYVINGMIHKIGFEVETKIMMAQAGLKRI